MDLNGIEFLQLVRKRWNVILGIKSLRSLDLVYYGYTLGRGDNYSKLIMNDFDEWLFKKMGKERNTLSNSSVLIMKLSDGNDELAFERFFTLLDNFFLESNSKPEFWELSCPIPKS